MYGSCQTPDEDKVDARLLPRMGAAGSCLNRSASRPHTSMSVPPLPELTKDQQIQRNYGVEGEDHELRGLLSGVDTEPSTAEGAKRASVRKPFDWLESNVSRKHKHLGILAVVFILLLLGAALVPPYLSSNGGSGATSGSHPNSHFVGSELRSNGTHDFKRTVLIVSIDGLRYATMFWCMTPSHLVAEQITLTEGSRRTC